MGKTVSIYLDDELLEKLKARQEPVSRLIRRALKKMLDEEPGSGDYDRVEDLLRGRLTQKGLSVWKDLLSEPDRW